MSHCDACNEEGDFSFSIQVHSFPRDGWVRKRWIQAVQDVIEGWTPKEDSVICSKHFRDTCYKKPDPVLGRPGRNCRALRDDAVPTIFKTTKKMTRVRSDQENERLRLLEIQMRFVMGEREARARKNDTDSNKQVEEELQPQVTRSTVKQHQIKSEMDTDVGAVSDEGISGICDQEVQEDEKSREEPVAFKHDDKERTPTVFFEGDLNLPLRNVYEQIAKIKEERAMRASIDQDGREGVDKWWSTASQDFGTKLDTYMQQLEISRSNIPVTFDPSESRMLSMLGDSQETVRLKEELTVPCLGKIYSSNHRPLCPNCGSVLEDMTEVVQHMCKFKRKALTKWRFGHIPDIVFIKNKKWKHIQSTGVGKAKKKTQVPEMASGLVDVFDMQDTNRLSDRPFTRKSVKTETKIKKGKQDCNLWKKLRMKQKTKVSSKKVAIMKKKGKTKKTKKKKKKKKKKKDDLEGHHRGLEMCSKARSDCKSLLEQSLEDIMTEKRGEEKINDYINNSGVITHEAAVDMLFSGLESQGLITVKKEPVDPEYTLQSDGGHSQNQPIADNVNAPQVYPVSIIPSSLLLTSLNSAACPESNESLDLDERLFQASQMGSFPDPAFLSPVQYENPGAAKCLRCDFWCESEKELGWHQCLDSSLALPAGGGVQGGGGGDAGGGGGGIILGDGMIIKAEPMDDR